MRFLAVLILAFVAVVPGASAAEDGAAPGETLPAPTRSTQWAVYAWSVSGEELEAPPEGARAFADHLSTCAAEVPRGRTLKMAVASFTAKIQEDGSVLPERLQPAGEDWRRAERCIWDGLHHLRVQARPRQRLHALLLAGWDLETDWTDGPVLPKGDRPLQKDEIQAVMTGHIAQARKCYEQELSGNRRLAGDVALSFVIEDGAVTSAAVRRDSTGSLALGSCLSKVLLRGQYPQRTGSTLVTYPYKFGSALGPPSSVLYPFSFRMGLAPVTEVLDQSTQRTIRRCLHRTKKDHPSLLGVSLEVSPSGSIVSAKRGGSFGFRPSPFEWACIKRALRTTHVKTDLPGGQSRAVFWHLPPGRRASTQFLPSVPPTSVTGLEACGLATSESDASLIIYALVNDGRVTSAAVVASDAGATVDDCALAALKNQEIASSDGLLRWDLEVTE